MDYKNIKDIDITSFVPIKNYENYLINRNGEVIRIINNEYFRYVAISKNKYNNLYFRVYKNNKDKMIYLANALATTFIPNVNNSKKVYHRNNDPLDNRLENLYWAEPDILSIKRKKINNNIKNNFVEIKNFPNYFINKNGKVIKLNKDGNTYKERKAVISNGYYYVVLSKNNKKRTCLLHRLLADTFIPNPKKLNIVAHKNNNRLDNRISNLIWIYRNGTITNKSKEVYVYEVSEDDKIINLIKEYKSIKEIVRELNISIYYVRKHLRNKEKLFIAELNKIVVLSHTLLSKKI